MTYTTSTQAAINEVQTASLNHFGGGNEIQAVTFGPGFAPAFGIRPTSVAINAAPSATSLGGAQEVGNTVTIATGVAHTAQVGDVVTISGVGCCRLQRHVYRDRCSNFKIIAVHQSNYRDSRPPAAAPSRFGQPGASEVGTTVTIRTSAIHNRSVGEVVTIAGVGVGGYNGTFTITAVPTPRTFQYTAGAAGLANSGGGTATFIAPFHGSHWRKRFGVDRHDSLALHQRKYSNQQSMPLLGLPARPRLPAQPQPVSQLPTAAPSAGIDVPNIELVNLNLRRLLRVC